MGLLDNAVPGGNLTKPLGIALLALLAYRATQGNRSTEAPQQEPAAGGGLGGILGGLLGGTGQSPAMQPGPQREEMQAAIPEGLNGLVERFQRSGLGGIVGSWIGTGANQPVAPHQVEQALEPNEIDELSRRTGLSREQVLDELARALPTVVDRLTPQGRIPQPTEMSRW